MSATWHDRDMVFDGETGWDEGDGVPVEVADDDTTTITVLTEHDRRDGGEHPAWTQGIARAVRSLSGRDDCWAEHMRTREERERALPVGGDGSGKGQTTDTRTTVREMKAVGR